jgi:hypothetical protein
MRLVIAEPFCGGSHKQLVDTIEAGLLLSSRLVKGVDYAVVTLDAKKVWARACQFPMAGGGWGTKGFEPLAPMSILGGSVCTRTTARVCVYLCVWL